VGSTAARMCVPPFERAHQMLESCFLVSANLVLMAGMVFSSGGFARGTTGYTLMTIAVAVTIIGATGAFLVLLTFEVYRSVKFAQAHVLARRVEEEAVEEALRGRRRRSTVFAGTGADGVARRPSATVSLMRRGSSLARRFSLTPGVPGEPTAGNDFPPVVGHWDSAAGMHSDAETAVGTGTVVPDPLVTRRRASVSAQQRGACLLPAAGRGDCASDSSECALSPVLEASRPSELPDVPADVAAVPPLSSPPPRHAGVTGGSAQQPQGSPRVPPPPPGPPRRPDEAATVAALAVGRPVARSARVQAMTSSRLRLVPHASQGHHDPSEPVSASQSSIVEGKGFDQANP
jgi:hypothetical protein